MVTSTGGMLCPSHVWDTRVGHGAVTTLGKESKVGLKAFQRLSSVLGVLLGAGGTLAWGVSRMTGISVPLAVADACCHGNTLWHRACLE